jgi:hypothetical protein
MESLQMICRPGLKPSEHLLWEKLPNISPSQPRSKSAHVSANLTGEHHTSHAFLGTLSSAAHGQIVTPPKELSDIDSENNSPLSVEAGWNAESTLENGDGARC